MLLPFLLEGNMKTEQILNLDCTKEQNKRKLNSYLLKVKPIQKRAEQDKFVQLELLEMVLHKFYEKYGYKFQFVTAYYEEEEFIFYETAIMDKNRKWLGNVYGKTLWELLAKCVIKIYSEIKKGE